MATKKYPSVYPRYYPEGLKGPSPEIYGHCAVGWESVRDVFSENLQKRLERGAATAVYHQGNLVVDLWAGERYLNIPWEQDTIVNVFSATKGIAALGLALLYSRGLLDYDKTVATYWPEFGCNGKENVTVRQLLSHSTGLCCIDTDLTLEVVRDPDALGRALATTKMEWGPEANKNGYMAVVVGFYDDQLCRRIDPKHRSIADFVKDEIFCKLNYQDEFYLGLPSLAIPGRNRIASLNAYGNFDVLLRGKLPKEFLHNVIFCPNSYAARSFKNPSCITSFRNFGKESIRSLIFPAGNGHATARALAAAYNALLCPAANRDDSGVGFTKDALEFLSQEAHAQYDEVLSAKSCFHAGFGKSCNETMIFGSSNKSFGCPGAGGTFAFCDPDADVAFAYVTNRLGMYLYQDPRELALRREVYSILKQKGFPSREQSDDAFLQAFIDKGTEKETMRLDPMLHSMWNLCCCCGKSAARSDGG